MLGAGGHVKAVHNSVALRRTLMVSDSTLPGLPPPLSATEFLKWMSTDLDDPGIYLLGSLNRHITVHSQQRRAVNLIRALVATGDGLDGKSVAIVGAGFAGLTAAAFALEKTTAEISLFDTAPRPLWLQDGCANRWLHPGIYDWPLPGSLEPRTALPVLNWRAGTAEDVARQVRAEWDRIAATKGRLHSRFESRVKEVIRTADGRLSVRLHDESALEFDVVVLAVGFGMERGGPGRTGYWNDADGLDGIAPGASVLVSGFGDGGLADVLRLCLPDIRQDSLIELVRLVSASDQRQLVEWDKLFDGNGAALDERYEKLRVEPIVRHLHDARPALARITLAGKGNLYGPRSAILNRFLVSQLRQARGEAAFELVREPVDESSLVQLPEGRSRIRFANGGAEREFDHVVLRLGPRAVYGKIKPLTDWKTGDERRKRWYDMPQSLDLTRVPLGEDHDAGASRDRREDFLAYESSSRPWCLVLYPPNARIKWKVHARDVLDDAIGGAAGLNPEPLLLQSDDAVATQASLLDAVRALCAADIVMADVTDYDPALLLLLGIRAAVRRGVTMACTKHALSPKFWKDVPFNLRELKIVSMHNPAQGHQELVETLRAGLSQSGVSPRYLDLPVYDYVREDSSDGPKADAAHVLLLRPFSGYDDARELRVERRIRSGLHLSEGARVDAVIDQTSPRLAGQRLYGAIRHWHQCVVDLTWWRPNVLFELGVRLAVSANKTFCMIDPGPEGDRTFQGSRGRLRDLLEPFAYDLEMSEVAFAKAFARPLPDDVYQAAARHFRTGQDHFTERVDTMLTAADGVTRGHANPLEAVDLTPLYASANPDYAGRIRHSVFEQLCAAWYYLADRDEVHGVRPVDLLDPRRADAFRRFHRLGSRLKNALALRYEPRFQRLRAAIEASQQQARDSGATAMTDLLNTWMDLRRSAPWNLDQTRDPEGGWQVLVEDSEDQHAQLMELREMLEKFDNPVAELPLQGVRLDLRRLETALRQFRRRLS
jgi:hypothetical protein